MPPNVGSPVQTQMAVAVLDGSVNSEYHGFHNMGPRQTWRRRIFVQTDTGSVLGIELDRADNVHTVKKKMQIALNVPTEESSLTFGDTVLKNDLSNLRNDAPLRLTRGALHRSSSTPCLSPTLDSQLRRDEGGPVEIVGGLSCCSKIKKLVKHVVKAVECGVDPIPVHGGLGGAYYFRNSRGECVAIVKPTDEEPFAPNNPKGFVGKILGQPGLKRSVRVGETGIREVAAYLLDHGNFAKVPPTVLVKITHSIFHVNEGMTKTKTQNKRQTISKIASFQQFVPHDFDASDHGTSSFPVAAVHRIGILDIRILNTDRHAGNLLVKKLDGVGKYPQVGGEAVELIPIDHGFCLPESLEDPYFEWLHWPQASIPFSEEELEYINKLDGGKDAEVLRMELPMVREACLRILMLCTIFLKKAAAAGLCLAEIGGMMSREFDGVEEEPSELEFICMRAKLEVDQEMFSVRSEGDSNFSEVPFEEEHLVEQFQFDMDYEEDDFYGDTNSPINGLGKESYLNSGERPEPTQPNGHNRSLKLPEYTGLQCLLPQPLSSQKGELQIDAVSRCTFLGGNKTFADTHASAHRTPRGGTRFLFLSNCPSPRTPRGGCRYPLSKLEEISPLEESEMQEPVIMFKEENGSFSNQAGHSPPGIAASMRSISFSHRIECHPRHTGFRKGLGRQGVSAAGAMQSGPELGALAANSIKFSEMSEEEWGLFIGYFQELLPDAFALRKTRNATQRHRLGTSCQF